MSPQPTVGTVAQELYDAVAPLAYDDERQAWALLAFCAGLTSGLEEIEGYIRDTDQGPGWSAFLDVDRVPAKALGWLAQFVGVTLQPGLDDAAQRARIRSTDGMKRGRPAAIVGAVQQYLTGTKTVHQRERDGSAYRLTIITYATETPTVNGSFGQRLAGPAWSGGLPADYKTATRFRLDTWAEIDSLVVQLRNPGGSAQVIKPILHADNNGAPGALLAVGNEHTVNAGTGASHPTLGLATPVHLKPGFYWLGVHAGATGGQINVATFTPGNGTAVFQTGDTYAGGPSNPFGAATVESPPLEVSALAGYIGIAPAMRDAVLAQKPAGIVLDWQVRAGQTWQQLLDNHPTWQDVLDDYASWEDARDDLPI